MRTLQTATLLVRGLGGATCGARVAKITESTLECIATIGKAPNRRLLVDSILCYGGTSPFVNFAFAEGAQGTTGLTYKIDTFVQVLNPVL